MYSTTFSGICSNCNIELMTRFVKAFSGDAFGSMTTPFSVIQPIKSIS